MAVSATLKLDDGTNRFATNCFPVRNRTNLSQNGAWLVAKETDQTRHYKAIISTSKTFEEVRAECRGHPSNGGREFRRNKFTMLSTDTENGGLLDGFYLMSRCCVKEPSDLCTVNVSGQNLTQIKENDLKLFNNVAFVNAADNLLKLEWLSCFPSVVELEMSLNGLRSVNLSLGQFPLLQVLDLSYNNLSESDVLQLGLLERLKSLNVSGNNLHRLSEQMSHLVTVEKQHDAGHKEFAKLSRFPCLEKFIADDNHLNNDSVFIALAGLEKLKHLSLEKNAISVIPRLLVLDGRYVSESQPSRRSSLPPSRPTASRPAVSQPSKDESFISHQVMTVIGDRPQSAPIIEPTVQKQTTVNVTVPTLTYTIYGNDSVEAAGFEVSHDVSARSDGDIYHHHHHHQHQQQQQQQQEAELRNDANVELSNEGNGQMTKGPITVTPLFDDSLLETDLFAELDLHELDNQLNNGIDPMAPSLTTTTRSLQTDTGDNSNNIPPVLLNNHNQPLIHMGYRDVGVTTRRGDQVLGASSTAGQVDISQVLCVQGEEACVQEESIGPPQLTSRRYFPETEVEVLKAPFSQLVSLNLANNNIGDENCVLLLAAWPCLYQIILHSNPLTRQSTCPLINAYLVQELGIDVQRYKPVAPAKPRRELKLKNTRKVDMTVPPIPRCNIDELLRQSLGHPAISDLPFNQSPVCPTVRPNSSLEHELASLESSTREPFEVALRRSNQVTPSAGAVVDKTTSLGNLSCVRSEPLPPIGGNNLDKTEEEKDQDVHGVKDNSFFMTETRSEVPVSARLTSQTSDNGKNEPTSDRHGENVPTPDQPQPQQQQQEQQKPQEQQLLPYGVPKEYKELYYIDGDATLGDDYNLPPANDISGNVRALKLALNSALVYRDIESKQYNLYNKSLRRTSVGRARREKTAAVLDNIKIRSTHIEAPLSQVLTDQTLRKQFKEANQLLGTVKRRYDAVRATSMSSLAVGSSK